MSIITRINAHEIRDSRGNFTIAVELETSLGRGLSSVPSGASVGAHEALELRDSDVGHGVSSVVAQTNKEIASAIIGKIFDQESLDGFLCELDGTQNKSRLGANATLAVSEAFARAVAEERGIALYVYLGSLDGRKEFHLPQTLFNVLNGGKHVSRGIDIQECMFASTGFASVRESVSAVQNCMSALRGLLQERGYTTQTGDEGGLAPSLGTNDEALELLVTAATKAGYDSNRMRIALDIAATSFYKYGEYILHSHGKENSIKGEALLQWYISLVEKYPLISIEDGFAEDDWDGFVALTKALGEKLLIVGDDLTVTNRKRIHMAVERRAVNSCIIKPNQVGTVTETIEAVREARKAGWKVCASHRSGETMDTFIADFAVGLSCDYLKAGAPTKEERLVKYNRLMEIEEHLHSL